LRSCLAFLTLAATVHADELQLKDGKKVEWVDLHDAGNSDEVTTPQGTKITVKKDDVESFATKKATEILTGGTISFDKKRKLENVDLVAAVDLKKDIVSGPWKMIGRSLSGGPGAAECVNKLQISGFTQIPEDYDLTVVVEKKEATNGIFFGLIGGGHQFLVGFDYSKQSTSGMVTNLGNNVKEGRVIPGRFWSGKGQKTIKFMVRKEAFVVQVDGKDFLSWKADWSKVDLQDMWAVPAKNVFLIAIHDASNYVVSSMVMSAPKEKQ